MRSIPTEYNGTCFRSRLEASFAAFLDAHDIKWVFEPKSFIVLMHKDGTRKPVHYLPDFFLPELRIYVECKGERPGVFWEDIATPLFEDVLKKECPIVVVSFDLIFIVDRLWQSNETLHSCDAEPWLRSTGKGFCNWLAQCAECKHWNILTDSGDHRCRSCGSHPGDLGHWKEKKSFLDAWCEWRTQMLNRGV